MCSHVCWSIELDMLFFHECESGGLGPRDLFFIHISRHSISHGHGILLVNFLSSESLNILAFSHLTSSKDQNQVTTFLFLNYRWSKRYMKLICFSNIYIFYLMIIFRILCHILIDKIEELIKLFRVLRIKCYLLRSRVKVILKVHISLHQ